MFRAVLRVATFAAAVPVAACKPSPPESAAPPAAAPTVEVAPGASVDMGAAPAPERSTAERCPRVAMSLVIEAKDGGRISMMSLAENGDLHIQGPAAVSATLDASGCLVRKGELWAEMTPSNKIWTIHSLLDAEGEGVQVAGAKLVIREDGIIERVRPDGSVEVAKSGGLRLEGYREEGKCAGKLMLAVMLAMTPSMAVVDGVAKRAPIPADSLCGAYERK